MSRDRLAAARAQRSQAVEMSTLPVNGGGQGLTELPTFLSEVTSVEDGIRRLNENVARISTLRAHSLNAIDDSVHEDNQQLDSLTDETRQLSEELKERIHKLLDSSGKQDAQMRRNRVAVLRTKFVEALQNYQRVEQEGRAKQRERVARQFRIVKPDATPQEVDAVVQGGGQQVFAQALTSSTRYAESRTAYREVQDRQQELRKMEQTLAELGQLFTDMATLVEQQDTVVTEVENTAKDVEANTEHALQATKKAVIHAASYRKGRKICFLIFVIIIIILAIVLGVVFGKK